MARNEYSGGKRKREADRQRKKHEKLERRQRAKENKGGGIPIATVEEIQAGPMRDPTEAATQEVAPAQPRARLGSARLFVGGLSWDTDEAELRTAFSQCGTVTDAKILTDRDTGRSRGFGFVTMSSADEAHRAIQQLDGSELDGRTIRVNEAVERSR